MEGTNNDGKILIVGNNSTQVWRLQRILEKHNYRVSVAKNGREALGYMNNHKPMIVISDIFMTDMNGYELCRQMKTDENFEDISIILFSRFSDREYIIKALRFGADSFITKPYNENVLLSRVRLFLANQELLEIESKAKSKEHRDINGQNIMVKLLDTPTKLIDHLIPRLFKSLLKSLF